MGGFAGRLGGGAMGSMKEHAVAIARGSARLWRVSPSAWLIALAMAASIVIRVIPLYLPAADISASQFIREKALADLVQREPAAARLAPSELHAAGAQW